jgi:protocatechuate 3,4-dioxygenase beta subunit
MPPRPDFSPDLINRKVLLQGLAALGGAVTLEHCSGGGASVVTRATATPTATPTSSGATTAPTVTPTPSATPGVNATPTATARATATATASATATATATATSTSSASCTVTNEGEIGPYFADDSASGFDRVDVVTNIDGSDAQSGVPLTLNVYVVDTENNCAPYSGAQLDIWHCNASGVYSDISSEGTSADTYLRGYQLTNSSGYAQFVTIIPGWYQGRTTHIHLRVRSTYSEASSTTDQTNTTQLFFPQSVVDYLAQNVAPYSAEGVNPTTNASDRVYSNEVDGQTLLTLSGSYASGFSATYTVGLPITTLPSNTSSLRSKPAARRR